MTFSRLGFMVSLSSLACASPVCAKDNVVIRYSFIKDLTLSYLRGSPDWTEEGDSFIRMKSVPRSAVALNSDTLVSKWGFTLKAGTILALAESSVRIACTLQRLKEITKLGGGRYLCFVDTDGDAKFDHAFVRGSEVLWGTAVAKVGGDEFSVIPEAGASPISPSSVPDELGVGFARHGKRVTVCRTEPGKLTSYCLRPHDEAKILGTPQTFDIMTARFTVEKIEAGRTYIKILSIPRDQQLENM